MAAPVAALLAVTLLCLAPPVDAGEPPSAGDVKAAQKQLAKLHKSIFAAFDDDLTAAFAELSIGLTAFDASLPASPEVEELFDVLATFQAAASSAAESLFSSATNGPAQILDELGGGSSLMGEYPAGFSYGDGGTLDLVDATLRKRFDRTYRKARKRVAKTVRQAEKHGLRLNVVLDPPLADRVPGNTNQGDSLTTIGALAVDLALGARFENEAEGLVIAGGSGSAPTREVSVSISSIGTFLVEVPLSRGRWSLTKEAASPANHFILATQGTGGARVVGKIGLR